MRALVLLAACAATPEPLSNHGGTPLDAAPDASVWLGEYTCEGFHVWRSDVVFNLEGCWWVP